MHALADDPDRATSGDPGAQVDALPECVTSMPKPWRGLDVLVQAANADVAMAVLEAPPKR